MCGTTADFHVVFLISRLPRQRRNLRRQHQTNRRASRRGRLLQHGGEAGARTTLPAADEAFVLRSEGVTSRIRLYSPSTPFLFSFYLEKNARFFNLQSNSVPTLLQVFLCVLFTLAQTFVFSVFHRLYLRFSLFFILGCSCLGDL